MSDPKLGGKVSGERPSRYHLAEQTDGNGWMIVRLNELHAGWSKTTATVVACNMTEVTARVRLDELRASDELDSALKEVKR